MASSDNKVRFAVVGLGWFGQLAVLPGFANAKNAKLAALVSGTPEKRRDLAKMYDCPAFDDAEFDKALAAREIDAVFIVTPNSAHLEYALRAARAGVHVLCEKPLADTVESARLIVQMCKEHNVKLMTAYRLHFQEANLKAIEHATSGEIGDPRIFTSIFSYPVKPGNVRLEHDQGGGPIHDVGVYCINAARYLFRDEPIELYAHEVYGVDPKFHGVPENTTVVMKFPGGRVAQFTAGFATDGVEEYTLIGTSGSIHLKPAYTFYGDNTLTITKEGAEKSHTFKKSDHVGAEIEYFADCILNNTEPEPDGVEGLIDMMIIEAIAHSAKENKPVHLDLPKKAKRPDMTQEIHKSAVSQPELLHLPPVN